MGFAAAIAGRLRSLTTRALYGAARDEMAVEIKSKAEIEKMRATCRLAASVLEFIEPHVVPGVTTGELDRLCHEYILKHGAYPSPLNYKGFPKSICTSVNEVICHGIPGSASSRRGTSSTSTSRPRSTVTSATARTCSWSAAARRRRRRS
jgi:hypothetical protein